VAALRPQAVVPEEGAGRGGRHGQLSGEVGGAGCGEEEAICFKKMWLHVTRPRTGL
jgi:hypothetical protein